MDEIIQKLGAHCINGITTADTDEIKKIPEIETNIDNLSSWITSDYATKEYVDNAVSGSSGSEWVEVDVSTYNLAHSKIDTYFYVDDNDRYVARYDMIIIYKNKISHVKKNSVWNDTHNFIEVSYKSSDSSITFNTDALSLQQIFSSGTSTNFILLSIDYVIIKNGELPATSHYTNQTMYRNRLVVYAKSNQTTTK